MKNSSNPCLEKMNKTFHPTNQIDLLLRIYKIRSHCFKVVIYMNLFRYGEISAGKRDKVDVKIAFQVNRITTQIFCRNELRKNFKQYIEAAFQPNIHTQSIDNFM